LLLLVIKLEVVGLRAQRRRAVAAVAAGVKVEVEEGVGPRTFPKALLNDTITNSSSTTIA
jgi:hypothetical protein